MSCAKTCRTGRLLLVLSLIGLALLFPSAGHADIPYTIEPIVKVGDTVAGFLIPPGDIFYAGPLNDRGQLVIDVGTDPFIRPDLLLQYADGHFTPIAGPGLDSPAGKFPADLIIVWAIGMNQLGNLVFTAARKEVYCPLGTFLWDGQAKQLTAVALKGMPAVNNLTFAEGNDYSPAINNFGDIVLSAKVKNTVGVAEDGLFFLGRDNQLQVIALSGQALPGGSKIGRALLSSINDAGTVAFLASSPGSASFSAYLWERGSFSTLVTLGTEAPGGGKFKAVEGVWVNNPTRSVLLAASVNGSGGPFRLYRFADGLITSLVVVDQDLPGGGKFKDLLWGSFSVSPANDAGQHVIVTRHADNTQGAYLVEPNGRLSLVLKSGTTTDFGAITRFGRPFRSDGSSASSVGVSLNNKGQIALPIVFDDGPETIVLLTPRAP